LLFYHRPQRLKHLWQVFLELFYCLAEIFDLAPCESDKLLQKNFQLAVVPDLAPLNFVAALPENRRLPLLKDDVAVGIPLLELLPYLRIKVVVCVLALPVPLVKPQFVLERSIGPYHFPACRTILKLGHKD
jgi:hypothetical protein